MLNLEEFWRDILGRNAAAIREYFHPDAWVNWHNTNERFTVEEFICANGAYPGEWTGEVERVITTDCNTVIVTHVYTKDGSQHYHVVSIIQMVGDKIASIDEYWGRDSDAPQWRQEKHIGSKIRTGEIVAVCSTSNDA